MNTPIKENTTWKSTSSEIFTVTSVYAPNEDGDPWVTYINESGDPFSCRAEAFLSRFVETVV
jgi:hypothetical protein